MADYRMQDARWTAIYVRETSRNQESFRLVPFELVRFNVDANPSAPAEIVPVPAQRSSSGSTPADSEKIYEKIWIVDQVPYSATRSGKHDFGALNKES